MLAKICRTIVILILALVLASLIGGLFPPIITGLLAYLGARALFTRAK